MMHRLAAIGLLGALLAGCATRVTVVTTATADPRAEERLVPGISLAVVVDPEAEPAALHRDLARKIETTLRVRGFEIVPSGDADALLFFGFGTRKYLDTTRTKNPVFETLETPDAGGGPTFFDHYFRLAVLEAEPYRKDGGVHVLWVGQAALAKKHAQNPGQSDEQALQILDLMWKGALEPFGRDQKRTPIGHILPR